MRQWLALRGARSFGQRSKRMEDKNKLALLVYDGDCALCRGLVAYAKRLTGEKVRYAPFQKVARDFPHIPLEEFRESVQLMLPNGEVYRGAHAVFQTLAYAKRKRWLLWFYKHVPICAPFSEWSYRLVSRNRGFFYRLTKFFLREE